MSEQQEEPIVRKTKHQLSMEALYAKHNQEQEDNGVAIDTSVDGFEDAANKLNDAVAAETGEVSLADVRDKRDMLPGEENPAAEVLSQPEEDTKPDPLEDAGLFYNEEGELCATVTVYGQEQVIPVSQMRRDYQSAEAGQRKFYDAAALLRRVEELQTRQPEPEKAEQEHQDILDQIVEKEIQVTEASLSGDVDEHKRALRELYALRDKRDQIAKTTPERLPERMADLTDEEVAANAWFAGAFPEIQGNNEFLTVARRQFELVRQERAQYGLADLSPFDLAREAGQRTERYLKSQGVMVDRKQRDQRRRQADSPPNPASIAARRSVSKSGATVTEDELQKQRAATIAARKRQQEQFKTQAQPLAR